MQPFVENGSAIFKAKLSHGVIVHVTLSELQLRLALPSEEQPLQLQELH